MSPKDPHNRDLAVLKFVLRSSDEENNERMGGSDNLNEQLSKDQSLWLMTSSVGKTFWTFSKVSLTTCSDLAADSGLTAFRFSMDFLIKGKAKWTSLFCQPGIWRWCMPRTYKIAQTLCKCTQDLIWEENLIFQMLRNHQKWEINISWSNCTSFKRSIQSSIHSFAEYDKYSTIHALSI